MTSQQNIILWHLALLFCNLSDFIICIPQNLEGMYETVAQTCPFC